MTDEARRKSGGLRPWHVVLGILGLLIGAVVLWMVAKGSSIKRQLAEIRAQGHPTSLAELSEMNQLPPEVENAAPLYEEVVFRGFMFKGIQHSKAGPAWAIIITSFVWAAIHVQYEIYYVAIIFLFGLLLGYVRLKSHSLLLPIGLHALMNFAATIETIVYIKYFLK